MSIESREIAATFINYERLRRKLRTLPTETATDVLVHLHSMIVRANKNVARRAHSERKFALLLSPKL